MGLQCLFQAFPWPRILDRRYARSVLHDEKFPLRYSRFPKNDRGAGPLAENAGEGNADQYLDRKVRHCIETLRPGILILYTVLVNLSVRCRTKLRALGFTCVLCTDKE